MRTHDGRAYITWAQAVFVRIENTLQSVKLFCGCNHPYVNFTHSAKSLRTKRAISTDSSRLYGSRHWQARGQHLQSTMELQTLTGLERCD